MADSETLPRTLPPEFELQPGFHGNPDEGLCALEAVAWIAGEPHSDEPACVCPTMVSLMRCTNDHMSHFQRQRLIPFLPRLVDTRDEALARPRAEELAWRAVTVAAPVPLRARGFLEEAAHLPRLPRHDLDQAKAAFADVMASVNGAAWAEAEANGARFWGQNVKVRPATWTSVEVMKLGLDVLEALAEKDGRVEDLAVPAARLIGAVGRFDDKAWSVALECLDALLALDTEADPVVVSLDDFRPGAVRAA